MTIEEDYKIRHLLARREKQLKRVLESAREHLRIEEIYIGEVDRLEQEGWDE